MIVQSSEVFAREISERWAGRVVAVSKTTPAPGMKLKIESARVAGWEDMPGQIKHRHGLETRFLVVAGTTTPGEGEGEGDQGRRQVDQSLVIPLDEDTAYDLRENRLLVITGREVVQFTPEGS